MPIKRTQWQMLENYLPPGTLSLINKLLTPYPVKLILTMPRTSVLGYYKPPHRKIAVHTITINKNLNPYAFLVVLLHEIAHLETYIQYQSSVKPHGNEWKTIFSRLLSEASKLQCFPPPLQQIIHKRIVYPASLSSCTDTELMRELRKWNNPNEKNANTNWMPVEKIPIGHLFVDAKGRKMQLLKKRRTRYLCREIHNGNQMLYPALMEVQPLSINKHKDPSEI